MSITSTKPYSERGRDLLMDRLREANIPGGESRERYLDITRRWDSPTENASVTDVEVYDLLRVVAPRFDLSA